MAVASRRLKKIRTILVLTFSCGALLMVAYGIRQALLSDLFLLRVVEVADLPENSPVDAQEIAALAAVQINRYPLFSFDLKPVEQRILQHSWIREARLHKRFPQTLSISVVLKEPKALHQQSNGALSYVDSDGKLFGKVNLAVQPDLPMLSNINDASSRQIALRLLEEWEKNQLHACAQVSSLAFDAERGFRALISYPLSAGKNVKSVHSMLELGVEAEGDLPQQSPRLKRVLKYLSDNHLEARQIWADAGKKIVVKIARGS